MSILIDKKTKVCVQGITGRDGSFHTERMIEYGTKVVCGVTPGKGGTTILGIPVYDTVKEAVEREGANTTIIFVPARFATDALLEAGDSGVGLVVCITEGIPVLDISKVLKFYREKGVTLIGPNSPGLISPGESKVGILPSNIFKKGGVGVISRSGTLTYELVSHITNSGLGESTCIGIGGDPLIGLKFIDCLKQFGKDPDTEAILMVGEIGGHDEEDAADFIVHNISKPVVAFVAGKTAPPGKRMGHAGAIISGGSGTAREKIEKFESVGIRVASEPEEVGELLKGIL
ncbi:succinate--CoA ligase subunit alpha [candidate division WOR-3 bacterium JGI_Cruoil_03_44_89]|uniref:Succinate--CoA ligase [ADP-forming] subunit alpha n=1 Tax=candidate division WOR-3 bacterium JGI_Cruoil_03_44_89 TaxID=1973748 RepID=A0A235BZW7_UNCW3|nr:MAG: succinate--CoA ligase subunit alpha [candidate division WOR-3 bacterium JGI_Cruoil_03_44_89]